MLKIKNLSERAFKTPFSPTYVILQILGLLLMAAFYFFLFFMLYQLTIEEGDDPFPSMYYFVFSGLLPYIVLVFGFYFISWFLKKFLSQKSLFLKITLPALLILFFLVLLPAFVFKQPIWILFTMLLPAVFFLPLFISFCSIYLHLKTYFKQRTAKKQNLSKY